MQGRVPWRHDRRRQSVGLWLQKEITQLRYRIRLDNRTNRQIVIIVAGWLGQEQIIPRADAAQSAQLPSFFWCG